MKQARNGRTDPYENLAGPSRGGFLFFGSMAKGNRQHELRRAAREVFEPREGRDLSDENLREIAHNLTGFFRLLHEWARQDENSNHDRKPKNSMLATDSCTQPGEE